MKFCTNMHVPQRMNPQFSEPLIFCHHEVVICSFD